MAEVSNYGVAEMIPAFKYLGLNIYASDGKPSTTTGIPEAALCVNTASSVLYSFKDGAWFQANALVDTTDIQELTGPGAISVTTAVTAITTTGPDAFTLANGTTNGQIKTIFLSDDGGDATITPSFLVGGTTITLSATGEAVQLLWAGGWLVLGGNGFVIA